MRKEEKNKHPCNSKAMLLHLLVDIIEGNRTKRKKAEVDDELLLLIRVECIIGF